MCSIFCEENWIFMAKTVTYLNKNSEVAEYPKYKCLQEDCDGDLRVHPLKVEVYPEYRLGSFQLG